MLILQLISHAMLQLKPGYHQLCHHDHKRNFEVIKKGTSADVLLISFRLFSLPVIQMGLAWPVLILQLYLKHR